VYEIKGTIVSTTAVPALGGCTVYLDICEVYYMRAVYTYLLLPREESISIKAPKGPKTRNTPHQTPSTSPRSLSSGYFHHSPFVMHSFSKGKTPRETEKKTKQNKKKKRKKTTDETKNLKSSFWRERERERALGSDSFKSSRSWSGTPAVMDHETSDSELFSRFPQPPLPPPSLRSLFAFLGFLLFISQFRLCFGLRKGKNLRVSNEISMSWIENLKVSKYIDR
jgi:hypothetical protein